MLSCLCGRERHKIRFGACPRNRISVGSRHPGHINLDLFSYFCFHDFCFTGCSSLLIFTGRQKIMDICLRTLPCRKCSYNRQ